MRTIRLTEHTFLQGSYAATIGFFDGVHLGHRFVVQQLRHEAARRGMTPMVVTFDQHPRQLVQRGWQPQLLSTLAEKEELLRQTGLDLLVVLPFTWEMAALSARDFMQRVLKAQLGVSLLLTGYDNHFGHREAGTSEGFHDYVAYGRELGIEVEALSYCSPSPLGSLGMKGAPGSSLPGKGEALSSSFIRHLIAEGRVAEAELCLGRSYSLSGTVVHGHQVGRTIGFPTANIELSGEAAHRLVPANGVYAVRVAVGSSPLLLPAITNIGMRPTFDGHHRTIETHILDFADDVYGLQLTIHFIARLRDEQPFSSPEQLAKQMACDADRARQLLTLNP